MSLFVLYFLICSAVCAPHNPATGTTQGDIARPMVTSPPIESSGLVERQASSQSYCGIFCSDEKVCMTTRGNVGCCRFGEGSACTIYTTCSGWSLSVVNGVTRTIGLLPQTQPVSSALIWYASFSRGASEVAWN